MYIELAILALFIFIYSLVAGRVERSVISGPMVFVVVGFLIGPSVLGWLKGNAASEDLRTLADLTLALVLFNDAATA
ncbi:MAG: cation:proton antiporter, partial [Lysobacterales bacterium]